MPSDAFAWLRDWIQGTANTSTEEPFLAESHAHLQAPHDGSDALKADEDLEGLFTGFDWDLSPRGSPEVCRRFFLRPNTAFDVLSASQLSPQRMPP